MWNLIFGDEDSSSEEQDQHEKKLKDVKADEIVVTAPTHQFSPGNFSQNEILVIRLFVQLLLCSCQAQATIASKASWRWHGRGVKLKGGHT